MKLHYVAPAAFVGLAAGPLCAQPAAIWPSPTCSENQAAYLARYATLDENHDGFVTADEYPNADMGRQSVAVLDTDHDGKISPAEIRADAMMWFNLYDTNHDGVISDEERAAEAIRNREDRNEVQPNAPSTCPAAHPPPQ